MRQTIVGVFDRYENARRAATRLEELGFDADSVRLTEENTASGGSAATADRSPRDDADRDPGMMASIRNFFAELFGGDDDDRHVGEYAEAVRRGHAVLRVDVDDESRIEEVRQGLQECDAVDIDEQVEQWRRSGWSGDATSATGAQALREDAAAGIEATARDTSLRGDRDDQVIPVVREDVEIGKRAVAMGVVRVYAHTVERPVRETVELREERARVERRPVDRPASAADMDNLADRTVEIDEMAERPVVQKTARVVEEVRVGKETRERTATVEDTVRQTEVEVRPSEGRADSTTGLRAWDDLEPDYRADYDSRYAAAGGRWEDYQPAYRYGHELAGESRYSGRGWEEIEPDVRSDWERRHPESAWERFKDAVRHGWDRVTGRVSA